jgi:hypothetical protein
MLRHDALLDLSVPANVAEDLPFAESGFAECMVAPVLALLKVNATATIGTVPAPRRGLL